MGIIYIYTNLTNNKSYIGQTVNPELRQIAHKSNAFNENNSEYDSLFHRAIRKYGWDNFKYSILATTEDRDALNLLEVYFIEKYNSQTPNGYNVTPGGLNFQKAPMSDDIKYQRIWDQAKLTEEEVIALRLAYQGHQSPSEIYESQYADRLHYQSFMNIWTGKRYGQIMPEVFDKTKNRHTKLDAETVKKIREDREINGLTHATLATKYNISKSTIADVVNYRTWKNV